MDLGFFTKRVLAGDPADAASDAEQANLVRELRAAAPFAGTLPAGSFNADAARTIRAEPGDNPVTDMKASFTFVF